MSFFVKLSPTQRKNLFKEIKNEIGIWKNFYPKYNISRAMFFNYLSGKYDIPLKLFNLWKDLVEFREDITIIEKTIYLKKEIKNITLDENMAEIIGVLNGDGHISKDKKEICVIGSKDEKDYALYLQDLFSKKLQINFNHLFFDNSCFKLKGYSVELSKVLIKDYGLPCGNKIGKLHIPQKILLKDKLLISYLRGLYDTDGTIYTRRKKDYVVEISSADKNYLIEIRSALKRLGFNASLLKNHVAIYKKEDIKVFFELIKPSNSKHLKRFESYSKLGAGSLAVK